MGHRSVNTSKNCSEVNTICMSLFPYTHVTNSTKRRLKINVATKKGKSRNKIWHWTKDELTNESLYKVNAVNEIQWSLVQILLRPIFYSYFQTSISGVYHIYELIRLHSCDKLCEKSSKTNAVTDEDNSRNEIWQWTKDEIGVAVPSWLWVQAELMAW